MRYRSEESAALRIGSWVGLVVAGAAALCSVGFFLWTVEAADLDDTLLPVFTAALGVTPVYDKSAAPTAEELRAAAEEATARGDSAAAITLWNRVKARQPADPRPPAAIAKLRTDLEDHE